MIYMFLSNNPSSGDINSSNLPCFIFFFFFGGGGGGGRVVDCNTCRCTDEVSKISLFPSIKHWCVFSVLLNFLV